MMNISPIPDSHSQNTPIGLPSSAAIANLRQTIREMAEWNRELAEIEAQLDSPRRRSANENYMLKN